MSLCFLFSFCLSFFHSQARAHCRVAVATLNTLAGYIDWVSLVYITTGNCQLLEMLCLLLSEPELQLEAAECLLIAISRKVSHRENTCLEWPWQESLQNVIVNHVTGANSYIKI